MMAGADQMWLWHKINSSHRCKYPRWKLDVTAMLQWWWKYHSGTCSEMIQMTTKNEYYIEYYIFWLLLAPRPLCWRCCAWRRRRVWCLEAPWMGWRSWKLRNHWRSNLLEGTCSEMIQLSKNEYYVSCTGPNAPRNVPENLGCLRVLWADWWNAPAPCV